MRYVQTPLDTLISRLQLEKICKIECSCMFCNLKQERDKYKVKEMFSIFEKMRK